MLPVAVCHGEVADWSEPDIDNWVYPNAFVGSGTRVFAPSFGSGLEIDPETEALFPGTATRLGHFVFAFDTTQEITPGLDPARYAINSVTVTTRSERGQGGSLIYETTPLTPASALAEVEAGTFGDALPMELFGVGFTDDFDGFALGVDQTGDRFAETNEGWNGGEYSLFPVDADLGRDVTNNLNGGFSATEPSGQTAPFVANPLAIGAVPGTNEGDALPNDTTFAFDLDLQSLAVLDYVREGLSAGVVGFSLSSLQTGGFPDPDSGTPYPQWYTKEAIGLFAGAEAPTLSIDFTILPLAGDFNDDGAVDTLDYDAWVAAYGAVVGDPGTGADGNADGFVDAADYTVWRDAFDAPASIAVPEPGAGVYALAGVVLVSFCMGTVTLTAPRGPRR